MSELSITRERVLAMGVYCVCPSSRDLARNMDTTVLTHREHSLGVANGLTHVSVDGRKVPVWEGERRRNISRSVDAMFLSKALSSAAAHPVCARLSTELTLASIVGACEVVGKVRYAVPQTFPRSMVDPAPSTAVGCFTLLD